MKTVAMAVYLGLQTVILSVCSVGLGVGGLLSESVPVSASTLILMVQQQLSQAEQLRTEAWAVDCVAPAHRTLLGRGVELTYSGLLLFPGSLAGNEGANVQSREGVSCDEVRPEIVSNVVAALSGLKAPSGAALVDLWRDELGLTALDVARFLVQREVNEQFASRVAEPAPALKAAEPEPMGYGL